MSPCRERGLGGSPCLRQNGPSSSPGGAGWGGLYLHNTDETPEVCSVSFFQAVKDPAAAPGRSRPVPRAVGVSAVDARRQMCIHIHSGGTSEIRTARRRSPPAWAPVLAEEVRSSVLQLPRQRSRASAVPGGWPNPAPLQCRATRSPARRRAVSPVADRGHADAASCPRPVPLQRRSALRRRAPMRRPGLQQEPGRCPVPP
ncbi:uncharacterized protein LOC141933679 [Strix aluco]|uniref:uncharacterized protein LOC141933679 n=1 Tax=Strix aluco TaxID=111821 RepID=UPI003DA33397